MIVYPYLERGTVTRKWPGVVALDRASPTKEEAMKDNAPTAEKCVVTKLLEIRL